MRTPSSQTPLAEIIQGKHEKDAVAQVKKSNPFVTPVVISITLLSQIIVAIEFGFCDPIQWEYIGAEFKNVKFSDVPIQPWRANFTSFSPLPLTTPLHLLLRLPLMEGTALEEAEKFISTLLQSILGFKCCLLRDIIKQYNLDGIDIDYEHFQADPDTFAECIGKLITTLKNDGVISFASIAPFDDDEVQSHYQALLKSYGHLIDC
ncbi:hypothetical protein HAX54_035764 [Datura stramonium]|uniref:GH18 domain-containing protein n=1 Tax=Datura stramonium TaxID=4076 RepID=A0ABS8RMC1_DATST|nr:hypothetical protein [Datura stramonium]